MNEVFDIRFGTIDELDEFIEILEEVGNWLWKRGIRQWAPGSNRAQRRLLEQFLRSGHLVTAHSKDRMVGGTILTRTPTSEWAPNPASDALYLHKLAVSRVAAGRGLGGRILSFCERNLRDPQLARIRLDCWDGNDVLREYYRSAGYTEMNAVESHGYLVRLFEKELS